MEYAEISVTMSKNQVQQAIAAYIKNDFPNKAIKEVIFNGDGSVKVDLKSVGSGYMDR